MAKNSFVAEVTFNESNEKKKNGVNLLYWGIMWSFQNEVPYKLL